MKQITLIVFIIVALVQLAVPLDMIRSKEKIITNGKIFHFKTAPIDPEDPFMGKYIWLNFDANRNQMYHVEAPIKEREAFARIKENKEGYAEVVSVSGKKPDDTSDYLKIKLSEYLTPVDSGSNELSFAFPFDRYYMEESKAPDAEKIYRRMARDTSQVAFAVVHVLNGEGAITDVMINGKSVRDIVKEKKVE